jgi:hypothetical protein
VFVSIESLEPRTLFAAPTILSERFNPDGAPSLIVQFSTDVSASIDNTTLILQNLNDLTTFQATSDSKNQINFNYNLATNTATWTFPKFTKSLPDSNYRAILYGERVLASDGTPMAADSIFNFAVFNGDTNLDGKINALDFNALASNYGKSARVYSQGDLNFDGNVNTLDFNLLATRFGQTFAAAPSVPRRMSVVTFNNNIDGSDRYTQSMFNVHNTPEPGGYFFFMGTDGHRSEILAQGNRLGIYYNNFNVDQQIADPSIMIQRIQQDWSIKFFTSTGVQPTWIVLNEISPSQWPASADYRSWVKTVVHALHVTYGHEVIVYSPFANPGSNNADWQALAKDAYIAVENYLSGAEMKAQNFSVNWAKSQYQTSITAYANRGVSASRLIEGEEYAMNTAGNGWGRDGVSYADWDSTIIARAAALHSLGQYFGTMGYAWAKNPILDTLDNQIHFIQTYRAQPLP